MSGTSNSQFGLLIAYVLPGFIALAGLTPLFPAIARWLTPVSAQGDFGLGPPLYAVFGAITLGLILSCFRWLVIDRLHRWTGVQRPTWDDRRLDNLLGGFDYLVQSHFRYYEFCGNTLLALIVAYGLNRELHTLPFLGVGTDVVMLIVTLVLFTASRDALTNYYTRTGRLVGHFADNPFGDTAMFNGNDHGGGNPASQPRPDTKPQTSSPAAPQPAAPKGATPRR